ncbi:MAG: hypothetical protein WCR06_02345 [bacterium]
MLTFVKRNPFTLLRIVTCCSLLALLGGRVYTDGPSINLVLFLLLVALWFLPTLLLNAAHTKTPRERILSNTLFAVLDAYVLMMASAEAVSDIWTKPFVLLGIYVFLASLLGGAVAGAASAISGFCGLLNGWLSPLGELQPQFLLDGAGTAVSACACGSVWRLIMPTVIRTAQQLEQESESDATRQAKYEMLSGMEVRLLEITTEFEQAQNRLQQFEAEQTAAAAPPPEKPPAGMDQPPKAKPPLPGEPLTPQAVLQQMEAELASVQAGKAAVEREKNQLLAEISKQSDELMAAFLPPGQ